MVIPGETVATGASLVDEDGEDLIGPQVFMSAAGHYIGYADTYGSPYSRESPYFGTREKAQAALDSGSWEQR